MFFSQHLNFEFWSKNFNLRHYIPRLRWKRIFGDILISRITDLKRNTVRFSCLKLHVRIKASGYHCKFPLSLITSNPDCHGGVSLDGKGRKCYRQFPWYEKLYLATFPKENSSLWIFTFNSVALQNLFVVYVVTFESPYSCFGCFGFQNSNCVFYQIKLKICAVYLFVCD